MDGRTEKPFFQASSIIVSGATGSGKTYWVYRLLKNAADMFEGTAPDKLIYCYGVYQQLFAEMVKTIPNLTFQEGLPTDDQIKDFAKGAEHGVIILDDLMAEVSGSADGEKLFTRGTHHLGLTVIYLVQNILYQNRHARTISLNTQYLVLFRNLRDTSQIMHLARQIYPTRHCILMDSYEDATHRPFGYIVINMHPRFTDNSKRLQTGIFPGDRRVYYRPMV